jgi:carbonic anhydrase
MSLSHLFDNNREWAAERTRRDPEFFERLSRQQAPEYLWIGCSDSRVPANEIVGLDVLHVKHIIVCGHHGCGGVRAALRNDRIGLADNWLRHVQDVRVKHAATLEGERDDKALEDRLCEFNVAEQVLHVTETTVVRDAWSRGQSVSVHGWVYDLSDGLLQDLGITVTGLRR